MNFADMGARGTKKLRDNFLFARIGEPEGIGIELRGQPDQTKRET